MNQPANPHGRDSSTVHGALSGLRVVDLTGDAGRFATKLLTELGADVVRVGTGAPGLPLADPAAAALGGVADWWYDGGKRRCRVDLSTAEGQDAYRRLADAADMVVERSAPAGWPTRVLTTPTSAPTTQRWCRCRSRRSGAPARGRSGSARTWWPLRWAG